MSTRTLFLAWQDKKPSKAWFPVGRLDADVERSFYRFRYIDGAKRAQEEVGFLPLIDFPDWDKDYQSSELFPLFQNRVMNRARPDFTDYLDRLDLTEEADPIEILSTNGGHRVTDASLTRFFQRSRKTAPGASLAGSSCMAGDISMTRLKIELAALSTKKSCTSHWN